MEKKRFHVLLEPETHRKVKASASLRGLTIGEFIQGLNNIVEEAKSFRDPQFQDRFQNLLDLAFANTGEQGGFGSGHHDVQLKDDGRGGTKADLKKLQEKIRQQEAEEHGGE